MLKNFFLFILFLLMQHVNAQVVVSGKVIDSKTKEILQGVNVYVNNTSIGTVTDSVGRFKLMVSNSGKAELVISHLVYQKKIILVLPEKSENLVIEMDFQNNMLNQVVIQGKKISKSNIAKWTELFSANLIGTYPVVSLSCKIKNPEVLSFNYDASSNQLQVFARRPILVENIALGYLIRLELDDFVYNFKTDEVVFKYSLFFEDLMMSKIRLAQVAKKRKSLYNGSNMHFMRSLYRNTVEKEGFSIFRYHSVQNMERARVEKIVRERIEQAYANETRPKLNIVQLFSSLDTINHYQNVMKQNRIIRFDTVKLASDAVRKPNKEWTLVNFNSNDTLMVCYRDKDPTIAKITHSLGSNSYLYFFNKEGINIQSNGYYPELGLFVYGDMGERRIAGILPFDYDPDEEL